MSVEAAAPSLGVEYVRPWLYEAQREAIFDAKDANGDLARYSLIEASTKAGKTAGCMAWLVEQAILCTKGGNYWWVAPVYPQAKIAYRRIKRGLPKWAFKANETELTITLSNGAVLWFKTGEKPDNLYGEDVYGAVIDEASRVREDSWYAVRSTLTATRGPCRMIGNVKGRKNWFYRLCRRAQQGERGMSYHKLTAFDAVKGGVITAQEVEDAKRDLPEHIFRELYLAEPSDDGGNPFGLQHIEACIGEMSGKPPVAIGIDLAQAVDWTVVIGLDEDCRVCGLERWRKEAWSVTEERIIGIVGNTPTLIDATGVGKPIYERVRAARQQVQPFIFTPTTKQAIIGSLAVGVQNHELVFPDGPIREEMEEFEYVSTPSGVRYSAPEGYHDDCVTALGLAYACYKQLRPLGAQGIMAGVLTQVSPWFNRSN